MAPGVPPGLYDLRVVGPLGVSNARFFCVGTLPEVNEAEPNNDVPEAQLVPLNATVNGVISSPTDVDYVRFRAAAGSRVTVHCAAAGLGSRARPLVEVYATDGRRLAQGRGPDVTLAVSVPPDGDCVVRTCEFAYQSGGPTHFYRLTLIPGEGADGVFRPWYRRGDRRT